MIPSVGSRNINIKGHMGCESARQTNRMERRSAAQSLLGAQNPLTI